MLRMLWCLTSRNRSATLRPGLESWVRWVILRSLSQLESSRINFLSKPTVNLVRITLRVTSENKNKEGLIRMV
ncbi:hypothetical protein OIU84_025795 [Salix udensis]|uniref:Uncharacterized protein n=1 Tax=Salix udensis TaxID=889485 RepID=A0AAD6PCV6_9ROSI|nr:hypothetical protein OIU84_025795 [Salix udensis]